MSFDAVQGKLVQNGLELEIEWASSGFSANRAMTPAELDIFAQAMRRQAAEYARIMSPLNESPAARALANIALLEAFERQAAQENKSGWSKAGDLANAHPSHPSLKDAHFTNEPKCNLFITEVFYEAGKFAAPKQMPSANGIANQATSLIENGTWIGNGQARWFDVVNIEEARFGDILVIHSKDRIDVKTNHGHVEFIKEIVRSESGSLSDIVTIGARSEYGAVSLGMGKRTTWGTYNKGVFSLHAATKIIRPRLAR